MKTKERLVTVLREAGLTEMAEKAKKGYYDDFESDFAMPINQLVRDLRAAGHEALAQRAMRGEWDGTAKEGRERYRREGSGLL